MKTLKVILAAAIIAATSSAFAAATLTISDGLTSSTYTDTDGDGVITFGSSFDIFWRVLVITGETKPAIGNATSPQLDLNIQASSVPGAPSLTITLSDINFGPTTGTFSAKQTGSVAGGPGATETFSTFYDAANVLGATTTPLTSTGPLPPPNYSSPLEVFSGPFSQPLYSLTEVVTIGSQAVASGLYHFDSSLSLVPEPGAFSLLLTGLSAFGIWRRRK